MAKSFSDYEAKRLIREHESLLAQMEQVPAFQERLRQEVKTGSEQMLMDQALELLKDISLEELNREKSGLRIKALRDAGYENMADIARASVKDLERVNGISQEGAEFIQKMSRHFLSEAKKGCKIRLSADRRTAASSRLVWAAAVHARTAVPVAACKELLSENKGAIRRAIDDLNASFGLFKWLFASKGKKNSAEQAYRLLYDHEAGSYGKTARESLQKIQAEVKLGDQEAWNDFLHDPIKITKIVEDIVPEVLGRDDQEYGLPKNLAEAIDAQTYDLQGMNCTLRRYQEWGVKYALHQKRVLLGDEMGLGKTIQAIAVMVSLRNEGASHFAVVCPASVIANWCREVAGKSDLQVIKVHGSDREKALEKWLNEGGVAVTTFEATAHFKLDETFRFELLVVDEAHYIKNPQARRTVNVKNISNHAEKILFMTGTALENRVEEMISLMQILQPDLAARAEKMTFLSAAPQFREEIAPVYYRRKREDVLTELPEKIENREWCTLMPAEKKRYEQAILAGSYTDARRVSWNIDDLEESSKACRLKELVEEAKTDGRKVIVFSFFLDTIAKVTQLLGQACMDPIRGSVPPQKRQEIIDRFDAAPAGAVLPAQIQSGGTGLNIQSASVVIICEPQFKPSIENQAISRAYRMGQARNVLVYRLLCEDTVDERITEMLEQKQKVFDAFADQSELAEESLELDEKSFAKIMQEEQERIAASQDSDQGDVENDKTIIKEEQDGIAHDENTEKIEDQSKAVDHGEQNLQ